MEALGEPLERLLAGLSREPDFDAPELQAHDTADLLLLETAAERIRAAAPGELVVIGDTHGALSLGAAAVLGARGVRVHQDPLLGERALARNAERLGLGERKDPLVELRRPELAEWVETEELLHLDELDGRSCTSHPLGEPLLAGARTVLVRLPRGLEQLEEIAWAVARHADPSVVVYAGGRVKHMTPAQNAVLGRFFGEVSAGLGHRKARVLTASAPLAVGDPPFPKRAVDRDLPFGLFAYGATFGGAKLDHGSRLLLSTLDGRPAPRRVLDLGCGNGVLAVSAALAWPDAEVVASDQSDAAVRATRLTAEAAGVLGRVSIHRADGTEAVPAGWADLVLLNPPFHTGSTVHAGVAHRLIRDCARVLVPGGELRLVFNSHLAYRPLVERVIGPVRQLARDRTFTVLAATRR